MIKKIGILLFVISAFASCSNDAKPEIENNPYQIIDKQVDNLSTTEDHIQFLTQIYVSTYETRIQLEEYEKNFFQNKSEIYELRNTIAQGDIVNLYKVETYLAKYPYPTVDKYGEKASTAIYYTILNSDKVNKQLTYFPNLKGAYSNGDIDKYNLLHLSGNIYYLARGGFFNFDKTHTTIEKLEDILPAIEEIREERLK